MTASSKDRRTMNYKHLTYIALLIACLLVFCEFAIYCLVLGFHCSYPPLAGKKDNHLKAVFIADTHLLGRRNGHWFDKLRREWQMYRAFQTSMALFKPDVVFFLGDLFDEGKWATQEHYREYYQRFQSLFHTPNETEVYVVAGNHDIGFHYATHPILNDRFEKSFNTKAVYKLNLKGNIFVLLNSMSMDRSDECFLCQQGERELDLISRGLSNTDPKPILLQHFPLYRTSDSDCDELDDAGEEKDELFREGYDCLSESSTDYLLSKISPRLVLTGHTHHGCRTDRGLFTEVTVSSYSWRNRNNPAFIIAQISPEEFVLEKCFLPHEDTVINFYCLGLTLILIYIIYSRRRFYHHYRSRR